jgi:hypothetical protein
VDGGVHEVNGSQKRSNGGNEDEGAFSGRRPPFPPFASLRRF